MSDATSAQIARAARRGVVFAELWTGGDFADEAWEANRPSATAIRRAIALLLGCSPNDVEYCADGLFRARATPAVELSWQGRDFDPEPVIASIRGAADAEAVRSAAGDFLTGPYADGASHDCLAARASQLGDAGLARIFATAAERLWAVDRQAYPSSREVSAALGTSLRHAQSLVRHHPDARRIGREWVVPASALPGLLSRPRRGWPKGRPRRRPSGEPT